MNNHRFIFIGIVSACLLLAGSAIAQTSKPGRLRAGAAKVDITPKESDLKIATDTIRDHLFARAIVVDNGNTCAVLVGLDMGGTGKRGNGRCVA